MNSWLSGRGSTQNVGYERCHGLTNMIEISLIVLNKKSLLVCYLVQRVVRDSGDRIFLPTNLLNCPRIENAVQRPRKIHKSFNLESSPHQYMPAIQYFVRSSSIKEENCACFFCHISHMHQISRVSCGLAALSQFIYFSSWKRASFSCWALIKASLKRFASG